MTKAERNKAWKELSAKTRARTGRCEVCGETENLCAHHILEKRVWPSLWLEKKDLVVLCRRCHFKVHRHQAAEFFVWLAKKKPRQWAWV